MVLITMINRPDDDVISSIDMSWISRPTTHAAQNKQLRRYTVDVDVKKVQKKFNKMLSYRRETALQSAL